ncbi:MAG: glutaredoxin family protein [Nanoarchaeota archaeon]
MQVRIYVKTGDPYSDMVKNLLKYYEVEHETIEVSRNQEKLKELLEISGQTNTPVLVVDDKVFAGFDREKIKEILGLKEN